MGGLRDCVKYALSKSRSALLNVSSAASLLNQYIKFSEQLRKLHFIELWKEKLLIEQVHKHGQVVNNKQLHKFCG
jgi:hypothetical protein